MAVLINSFVPYSFWHIFFLVFALSLTAFAVFFSPKLKKKTDKAIRVGAALIMLCFELVYLILKLLQDSNKAYILPLELCTISLYVVCYLLFDFSPKIFKAAIFWAFFGCFLSLIFPFLSIGFPNFRFFHFFITHGLVFFMAHYLFFREDILITYKDMWGSLLINLAIMLFIVLPINLIFDTNFMFIMERPLSVNFLFEWAKPVDLALWLTFVFALYNLTFLYIKALKSLKKKLF